MTCDVICHLGFGDITAREPEFAQDMSGAGRSVG